MFKCMKDPPTPSEVNFFSFSPPFIYQPPSSINFLSFCLVSVSQRNMPPSTSLATQFSSEICPLKRTNRPLMVIQTVWISYNKETLNIPSKQPPQLWNLSLDSIEEPPLETHLHTATKPCTFSTVHFPHS